MNSNDKPDPRLIEKIGVLNDLPERSPERASQGKAAFLAAAASLAAGKETAGAPAQFVGGVTPEPNRRHSRWMQAIQSLFVIRRKERSPMFSALSTLFVILSLVVGGSGAAVAAAQNSQPDTPLYNLKLASEDLRMDLEGDPADGYQLALAFAERRAAEIQAMLQAAGIPPVEVLARYQIQVEQAIQLALDLPNEQAVQALARIKTSLQAQEQAMLQIQANSSSEREAALISSRAMVQERLQWIETGLSDPVLLREQLRLRNQAGDSLQPGPGEPAGGAGPGSPGAGECLTCTPVYDGHNSQNPWTTETPDPGSGSGSNPGPGDGECLTCTPVYDGHNSQNPWTTETPDPGSGSSSNPGPGAGECADCTPISDGHNSQNPWTTGTPTSGSGYGPGPGDGDCLSCTPAAGPGPQPTPVPPQPTQSGPQPTQSGPQPTQGGPGGGSGGKP